MNDIATISGVIELGNPARGRYAIRTSDGDYTLFDAPVEPGIVPLGLEIGTAVEGPLRTRGRQILTINNSQRLVVFVVGALVSASAAKAWVAEPAE